MASQPAHSRNSDVALEVRDLRKRYRLDDAEVVALDGLSLVVERGEMVVILGPSGSGKSTLLHVVAGLLSPDQGEVFVHGQAVAECPPGARGVAMVLQNLGLYPNKTVVENVAYPMRIARLDAAVREARTQDLLRLLHLEAVAERFPQSLSGGQRQRVAIARGLARDATLLLLDEPFSDLDAQLRLDLRRELKALHLARGLTTLLVTHDQEDAVALADRIALVEQGRVVEMGPPRRLYQEPQSLFAARFLGRPPMNLFEVHLSDDAVLLRRRSIPLPISLPRKREWHRGDALLGIRPELLLVTNSGPWVVRITEGAGAHDIAYVELLQDASIRCAVRLPSDCMLHPGMEISLRTEAAPYLFDSGTGKRLA